MAYIVNPDGTISFLNVKYDSAGNMRIAGMNSDYSKSNSEDNQGMESNRHSRRKKKNKNRIATFIKKTESKLGKIYPYINLVEPKRVKEKVEEPYFISPLDVDRYIGHKKRTKSPLKQLEFESILATLKDPMRQYFIDVCKEYVLYCEENNIHSKGTPSPKKKNNKKHSHNKKDSISPNSIGARAIVSKNGKRTETSDFVFGRSLNGATRGPKYGYARDYFGRVQERDRYDEERNNEYEQSRRSQRNYDYSNFDSNDDNDGSYEGWE